MPTITSPARVQASAARRAEPTLSPGDKGAAVVKLQQLLQQAGHSPKGSDGEFGPNTKRAVQAFQRASKLPATGVANGATWNALERQVKARRERVFVAATKPTTTRIDSLIKKVDRFTNDGKLSRTERSSLLKSLDAAERGAQPLVADQSKQVLNALARVKLLTRNGTLTKKSERALSTLRAAKKELIADAKHDATHRGLPAGWKQPFNGVATKTLHVSGLRANVVAIDLADPRVKLQTNSEGARGKTVQSFAQSNKAEVAINGDFFSWGSFKPSGLAVTNGKQWKNTEPGFEGLLAFNGRHAAVMKPNSRNPDWSNNAVSARPTVLIDGKLALSDPNKNERSARTGIGISKDGRTLYLVAVEGRSAVNGLTATDLGKFMRSLGADDALAMDSGGSAQLYVKGRGMVQRSTDPGGARAVANVVMVQSR